MYIELHCSERNQIRVQYKTKQYSLYLSSSLHTEMIEYDKYHL